MTKSSKIFCICFGIVAAILTILSIIFKWSPLCLLVVCLYAWGIFLQGKRKRIGLIVSIAAHLAYVFVAYQTGYIGDATFYLIVAIPINIVTFAAWSRHLDEEKLVEPRRLDNITRFSCLITAAGAVFVYGKLLTRAGSINPYLDAASTVTSLFGYSLSFLRYREHWISWMLQACVSLTMYILVGNVLFIIGSALELIEYLFAIRNWKAQTEEI